MIGAQALGVALLFQRLAEHGGFGAQSVREFHSHVAEAAQADDRHFFSGACVPVHQRRIKRDAGA